MKTVYLFRINSSNQGTQGIWVTDGFQARTIELPWRDNQQNISCIPANVYICHYRRSRKFGDVYMLTDVQSRTWILTHSGNLAGDVLKGYKTHSHGCVLMGAYHGVLCGQKAVLLSKPTLAKFIKFMNKESFKLVVIDSYSGL